MSNYKFSKNEKPGGHYIYCRYIVRNGVKVYPKTARAFRIWVED